MASPTRVSFFLDDVAPYATGVPGKEKEPSPIDGSALVEVLDYLRERGMAAAISVIPGMYGGLLTRPRNAHERGFAEAVGRFGDYPVDAQMEIMTHGQLFDFSRMAPDEGAPTEGDWLDDHAVSVEEYRDYFLETIKVGRELGVRYGGVTTPGVHPEMNPNVWSALLELAEAGEFPAPVVGVFVIEDEQTLPMAPRAKAVRGRFGVYDLPSGVLDHLACWLNSPERVDIDRYIDEEGNGRLAAMIEAESPMALFCMHWQGLNPQTGIGWPAFRKMVDRLTSRFGDRIVWQRPSEIAAWFHRTRESRE